MTIFAKLGLNKTIQANLDSLGYKKPTDIQSKSIGAILSGSDTYAIAPTGTGKTAAYLLPILQELSQIDFSTEQIRPIRALFLVPTRELAQQVEQSIMKYGKDLRLRTISVFGGIRIESQTKRFKRGTDILVATPKRLIDLMKTKVFNLAEVQHFIMDEADRLVGMGITRELDKILAALPKKKQTILFSATDSKTLNQFSLDHLANQKIVKADGEQPALDKIKHTMFRCYRDDKDKNLFKLLELLNCDRALIFIRTKKDVDALTEKLNQKGFSSEGIHNEIPLKERKLSLAGFKNKSFNFLIATDIASRGLDIDDLYYVINYDLPTNSNDYIHRVGRTARTGASKKNTAQEAARKQLSQKESVLPVWAASNDSKNTPSDIRGHAYSFVSPEQERLVSKISELVGKKIQLERIPF